MKLGFGHKLLIIFFFMVMVTSLWPNNIYLLVIFSIITYFILPIQKWWNVSCILLLIFSLLYAFMEYFNMEVGSGFILLSHIFTPVAFYRFGNWIMSSLNNNHTRLVFIFFTILSYLFPLFILTAHDISLVGFINESRKLNAYGDYNISAATLYGLMLAFGIGCVSMLFTKEKNFYLRISYIILSFLAMIAVIHLVNRTGIVLFVVCILVSFVVSTKLNIDKIIPAIIVLILFFIIIKVSIINNIDVINAYSYRESDSSSNVTEIGGRSEIWLDAINKLITHPFGWERIRYAHNLWLDIARIGGWLALMPFLILTIIAFKNIFFILKRKMFSSDILLVTIFVATFLNASVEPVIEGSMSFFSLMLMFWGMIESAALEKCIIKNKNIISVPLKWDELNN